MTTQTKKVLDLIGAVGSAALKFDSAAYPVLHQWKAARNGDYYCRIEWNNSHIQVALNTFDGSSPEKALERLYEQLEKEVRAMLSRSSTDNALIARLLAGGNDES